MLHELLSEMDPEYRPQTFLANRELVSDLAATTINTEPELDARAVLSDYQLSRVQMIRSRKLASVLERFRLD